MEKMSFWSLFALANNSLSILVYCSCHLCVLGRF